MKTFKIFFIFFVLFINMNCSQEVPKNSKEESEISNMLKSFYTAYITENAQDREDFKRIEILKTKYCTKSLLNSIRTKDFDADPFINGQDYNEEWVKTLTVNKVVSKNNQFEVCFIVTYDNSLHCVKVTVKKEGEMWKIDGLH